LVLENYTWSNFKLILEEFDYLLIVKAIAFEIRIIFFKTFFNLLADHHHVILPIIDNHINKLLAADHIVLKIFQEFLLCYDQNLCEASMG